jgi:hypothetical protein
MRILWGGRDSSSGVAEAPLLWIRRYAAEASPCPKRSWRWRRRHPRGQHGILTRRRRNPRRQHGRVRLAGALVRLSRFHRHNVVRRPSRYVVGVRLFEHGGFLMVGGCALLLLRNDWFRGIANFRGGVCVFVFRCRSIVVLADGSRLRGRGAVLSSVRRV